MKIININQQTNNRFLNLYEAEFENGVKWTLASRRSSKELMLATGKTKADTVTIIPILNINGKTSILMTKEFRYPLNDNVWSFPAGLVEEGESPEVSAIRELEEEIGAKEVSALNQVTGVCFKSEGLTDETACVYEAVISKLGKQNLQDSEDIKVFAIEIEDIPKFIDSHKNSMSQIAALYLPMIYKEYMLTSENELLREKLKKLEEENQKLTNQSQPQ